jgi:riboflavin kinase/FMN adenylyltransferase
MMNIGVRPTVNQQGNLSVEVHLFDFNEEIYGETIKIKFKERIRDEIKFTDLSQLKVQLKIDKGNVIEVLNRYSQKSK